MIMQEHTENYGDGDDLYYSTSDILQGIACSAKNKL
jgi:hypothetical protein